jgi:hypothetical protein
LQKTFEKDQEFASLMADLIEKAESDPSLKSGVIKLRQAQAITASQ